MKIGDPEFLALEAALIKRAEEIVGEKVPEVAKAVAEQEVLRTILERLTSNATTLRAMSELGDRQMKFTEREVDLLSGLALKVQIIEAQIEAFTQAVDRVRLPPPSAEAVVGS